MGRAIGRGWERDSRPQPTLEGTTWLGFSGRVLTVLLGREGRVEEGVWVCEDKNEQHAGGEKDGRMI